MTLSITHFFLPLEILIWLRDSLSPVKANKAPSFLILIISPLLSEMKTDDLEVLTTIPSERVSPSFKQYLSFDILIILFSLSSLSREERTGSGSFLVFFL